MIKAEMPLTQAGLLKESQMFRRDRCLADAAIILCGTILPSVCLAAPGLSLGGITATLGATSLTGQVLTVDGVPLPNVALSDGRLASTKTDAQGRFLLEFVPAGKSVMRIDGRHGGIEGAVDYGTYEVQVQASPNRVTALPFVSWLTPINHADDIVIPSPTTSEVILRTPRLPGAELIIPAGTILTDWDGKRINRVSLTPIRPDRPPFPLPRDVRFTDYFTAQPGGTTLWTVNGARGAAKVIYPNHGSGIAGSRSTFWHYHPATVGWLPYGGASVSADGKSIVADEQTTVYDFMGGGNGTDPGESPSSSDTASASGQTTNGGEPVDLASGLFTSTATDLTISDVMPISVTRNYMSSDTNYRDFGLGISLSYEMYSYLGGGSSKTEASEEYSSFQIITPTSNVLFTNTTPAYGDYSDALFVAQTAPGPFLQAQAYWTGNGFEAKRRDGTVYAFGYHSPLTYMQDRFGNRVTLTYQQVAAPAPGVSPTQSANKLVKVTSPNGRFVQFTWMDLYPGGKNSGNVSPTGTDIYAITKAVDNLGRETDYAYDACGRLKTVLDEHAIFNNTTKATTYTWTTPAPALGAGGCPVTPTQPLSGQAPLNLLASINDQSTNLLVQNDQYEWAYTVSGTQYKSAYNCETPAVSGQTPAVRNGRVCHQNVGPPGLSTYPTYSFAYTVDPYGNIQTAVVTDPRSHTRKVDFSFPTTLATQQAAGTITIPQSPGYASDETYAADDTNNSQKWIYSRDPATQTLLQVTAPPLTEEGETAGRVTAFCYDNLTYPGSTAASPAVRPWNLTSVVRNLVNGGNPCPSSAQTASTTQNATILFTYSPTYNLVTSITDPNGNVTAFNRGGANPFEEALSTKDANGNTTSFSYASDGQVQSVSQVANANQTLTTKLTYDHNDLVSTTAVGSDVASRVSAIYTDGVGRPIQNTDPLGDVSITRYDPIFGPQRMQDANGSFEVFLYTANGTLVQASQPNGTSLITYNQANLRSTFTDPLNAVASNYYDASNNLTCTIDRRGNQANFTYDSLNRVSAATYYKGSTSGCSGTPSVLDSTVTYSYDHGNRLLKIVDSAGGTTTRQYDDLDRLSSDMQSAAGPGASIGTVAYNYDIGGRLTSETPTNVNTESFTYDPGNRLVAIARATTTACINYDQANRRTQLIYPDLNGTTANYSWDTLSDETQLAYTQGGSYTAGNSAPCNPGTTLTGNGTGTLTYGYDQDGRQMTRGGSYFTLVAPSSFAATGVAYNADNQQTMWNSLDNVFDGNGNLTCTGSSSATSCAGTQSQLLTWDARNRLVTAAASPALMNSNAETYVYDGLSRRQSVTVPAASTMATYLYRGLDPVLVNTTSTTTGSTIDYTKVFLSLGLDERLQLNGNSASNTGTVITDSQNSTVRLQTNKSTTVAYSYPPFGSLGAASTSSINPFRYTGREASDNTGLYYYRARYYSPGQSRFIQEDPLGLTAGPNVYAYAGNDPLDYVDPLGLATLVITSGYNGGYNFFGHSALAFTGQGVYSYGTAQPYGSSVTAYLHQQLADRSVTITTLNTTPQQEQSMAAYYQNQYGPGSQYSAFGGRNCADASGGALTSSGALSVPTGLSTFPSDVGAAAAAAPGATTMTIPAGSQVPASLGSFNPQ